MTITTNIFTGPSWLSGTAYSVGDRVLNSSNLMYEATSTGTAGSTMPTGTGTPSDGAVNWKYLVTVDYTSLAGWGSSVPSSLSQSYVGQVWRPKKTNGAITTTDRTSFLVFGTSGTPRTLNGNSITLKCAAGESFRDNLKGTANALAYNAANGVAFVLPSSGTGGWNYFDLYDSMTLDGFQFRDPYSTSSSTILNSNSGTVCTIAHNLFDGYAQAGGACIIGGGGELRVSDTLVVDRTASGSDGVVIVAADNDASSFCVNSTFVRINHTTGSEYAAAFSVNNAAAIFRNCIVVGYTNPVGGVGNQCLVDHMVTDSSTVGYGTDNGNNTYSVTPSNEFYSTTTDFRIKPSGVAYNGGVADSTHVPANDDILGYSRPQGTAWSIGAAEYTGQMAAAATLGAIALAGGLSTANNASLTKSIGAISAVVTTSQAGGITATISLGGLVLSTTTYQSNLASGTARFGALTTTGSTGYQTAVATATMTAAITPIASAAQSRSATATATLGAFQLSGAAIYYNAASLTGPIGPISSNAAGKQDDLVSANVPMPVLAFGYVTASIDYLSAAVSLALIAAVNARQEVVISNGAESAALGDGALGSAPLGGDAATTSSATAGGTLGAFSLRATAVQIDYAQSTVSIGAISLAPLSLAQFDAAAGTVSIGQVSLSAAAGQVNRSSAQPSIGTITSAASAFPSVGASSTTPLGGIVSTGSAIGQSAQAIMIQPLGAISAVGSASNPYPMFARATLGPISAVANSGYVGVLFGTATFGFSLLGSSNALLFGYPSLVISASATATNPLPMTAQVSLGALSLAAIAATTAPLLASAVVPLGGLRTSSAAYQSNLVRATPTIPFSLQSGGNNAPKVRVSQIASEVLTSGGNLRVSQTTAEVLTSGGRLRVSQAAVEVLVQSVLPSNARVSQVTGEVLVGGTPNAVVVQAIEEVVTGGSGAQTVRMTQTLTEVLTGGSANQTVLVTQVVLETLISAVPIRFNGQSFVMC